jgi:hypothetical protein
VPRKSHRPSNLTLSVSTFRSEADAEAGPSSPSLSSRHRATNSEPSVVSTPLRSSPILSPGEYQSYLAFSPTASTPPLTGTSVADNESVIPNEPLSAPARVNAVSLKISPSCRSTASVATRQRNRSAALAALEGRAAIRRRMSIKRNFMSMSDDDEDDDDIIEIEKQLLGILDEEEDVVIPEPDRLAAVSNGSKENVQESKRSSMSSDSKRSKRSTLDSLLSPLTNFIDLRDDEVSSRSWRSFVELA